MAGECEPQLQIVRISRDRGLDRLQRVLVAALLLVEPMQFTQGFRIIGELLGHAPQLTFGRVQLPDCH